MPCFHSHSDIVFALTDGVMYHFVAKYDVDGCRDKSCTRGGASVSSFNCGIFLVYLMGRSEAGSTRDSSSESDDMTRDEIAKVHLEHTGDNRLFCVAQCNHGDGGLVGIGLGEAWRFGRVAR